MSTCKKAYQNCAEIVDSCPADSDLVLFVDKESGLAVFRTWETIKGCIGAGQNKPATYIVGVDDDAPNAGSSQWAFDDFDNKYVSLFINGGGMIPLKDPGDGGPYITKLLNSDTITITNYQWADNDILSYILS